jgi:2-polyprenyl-3-methyl-5-hydroxy-6-metoxy-1,4-benzoquinol methylase
MAKDSLKEYNQWHEARPVDSHTNTPWHNFVKANIKNVDLKGKKVLEIGCGRGGFSCWLAENANEQFDQLIAADFSEAAVLKAKEYAQSKGLHSIDWQIQDIQNISFPDEYFDIIVSCETIEHVPSPLAAINELYRVMKPGGMLYLTTPNYLGFFGLYRIYLRLTGRKWTEGGQPINQFMLLPRTISWIKKAGFILSFFDSSIISVPFPGKRKVLHFNIPKPATFLKWFGLQSYFIAVKN